MAIPAGVQRIVFFGQLPGGEIWETGFWLQGGLPTSDDAAATQAELVFNVFLSESDPPVFPWLQTHALSSGGNIQGARCYAYPSGGPSATYVGEYTAPSPLVGSSSYHLPDQVCLVTTLLTGASGRRNRGRMYWPAPGLSVVSTSQFVLTDVQTLADDLAAAFRDLASSDAGVPCVVSVVGSTSRPISSVKVDTIPDIQRRRANKLAPVGTYSAVV